jgi:hypothetical protein
MDGARGGVSVVKLVEGVERVENTFVGVGEVELVGAVEVEEEGIGLVLEILFDLIDGDAVGGGERAADKHWSAVADEAGDGGVFESGAAYVFEGGVDTVAKVLGRIDEGAVEVEYEELEALDRNLAKDVDHGSSVGGARVQGTGFREQGTGNREQGTGNREQGREPVPGALAGLPG